MPSNSPNLSYLNWFDRARSHPEFRSAAEQLSTTGKATDRLFFGVRTTTEGAAGIYAELYYEPTSRILSACMLTFVAPEDGFLVEEATKIRQVQLACPVQPSIDLTSSSELGRVYFFTIHLKLVEPLGTELPISSFSARLHKNYSAAPLDYPNILPTTLPSRDQNLRVSGRLLSGSQFFCPNCSGIGAFDDMAIPKADWESSATGYALYSCNRVSGRVACTVCGGTGGKFQSWYLDEHPDLSEFGFAPGSGLQPASE